jgi:SNF family Na+-dependent transporter
MAETTEAKVAKEPEVKGPEPEIQEYADGWISERKGTGVPTFLKFAYIVIIAGVIGYFFLYMNGEVNHSDRGALVRQFNQVTQSSPALMYAVIAMVVVYAVIVVAFAFKAVHKD